MDTIVAQATARGRAGVAVIRVSGPRAWDICGSLVGPVPEPRKIVRRWLRTAEGELIDDGLVVVFESGKSFTGERIAEFHVHGSAAVTAALLREILREPEVRLAEAGEFTRRAFDAGKMSLVEVEALADLLQAETEGQRKLAQRILDGTVSRVLEIWREDMLNALAMLEAAMDFSDEEIPDDLLSLVLAPLQSVLNSIRSELGGRVVSERIREGFEVAIIGNVNSGKSTLLNALAGREAAITSERAGTTRDVIEVRMDVGGLPVTFIDTAGFRDTDDEIERIGIERGRARARRADLRVVLKEKPDAEIVPVSEDDIIVLGKSDLWSLPGVSGKTGAGLAELVSEIESRLLGRSSESSIFSHARHFNKLSRAADHLEAARSGLADGELGWELVADEIRGALRCLDGIIGRIDVEDVLGRIFGSFCIGK